MDITSEDRREFRAARFPAKIQRMVFHGMIPFNWRCGCNGGNVKAIRANVKAKGKKILRRPPDELVVGISFCLNSRCCLCPPDSASRNETKRKQPADGQRSGAVAKRREVKRSRTGRTQALNFEWRRQSAVFSRFWKNQRRSPVRKIAV